MYEPKKMLNFLTFVLVFLFISVSIGSSILQVQGDQGVGVMDTTCIFKPNLSREKSSSLKGQPDRKTLFLTFLPTSLVNQSLALEEVVNKMLQSRVLDDMIFAFLITLNRNIVRNLESTESEKILLGLLGLINADPRVLNNVSFFIWVRMSL